MEAKKLNNFFGGSIFKITTGSLFIIIHLHTFHAVYRWARAVDFAIQKSPERTHSFLECKFQLDYRLSAKAVMGNIFGLQTNLDKVRHKLN